MRACAAADGNGRWLRLDHRAAAYFLGVAHMKDGELNHALAKRGGPGRGQGRKARDGATGLVQAGIRVRADQKPKLLRIGGSVWVRRKIDEEAE